MTIAALVLLVQLSVEIKQQERDFQQKSESLHELIRQRLDQNEAVLGGFEALFNTFKNLQFDDIRGYSREMLSRYPHIYTIELQPRVDFADVDHFQKYASKKIKHRFQIKDFGFGDERSWHPVTKRPFYYPITFMEPPIEAASPILGLDVYADPKFHDAINQAIVTGKPSVSAPFNLLEGGRGYLIFKAIFKTSPPSTDRESRFKQATQVVSMLIHTNKFLRREELPSSRISMSLYHRGFGSSDPNGLIDRVGVTSNVSTFQSLLPAFVFSKLLPSESQPFVFETRRQLGWEILHPLPTLFSLGATLAIVLLLAAVLNQRRVSQLALKKNEDVLFREKEKALVTLHSITDAVITLDANGLIEYMNPAVETAIQRKLGNVKGKRIDEVLVLQYELSQSLVNSPFATCINERRSVDLPDNSVMLTVDGQHVLIEGSVSPLFDSNQTLIGAVVAFRDMGPIRKRALETVEASEKRLRQHQSELAHVARLNTMGEMASGIAHEINQPLAAILSYNQACIRMLQDEEPDAEEIVRAMQSAAAQSKRAGEIIKRLRAFVSKQATRPEPVDLNQVIQNALTLIEHGLRDHQVTVQTNLALSLPPVIADGIQLEQVVLNLIRNGMDAMKDISIPDKIIAISTRLEQNRVVISVQDYGHGISHDVANQLFHPFFTTKSDGMGLGLTISYSIVEAYGGILTAHNLPDGGAEFSFSLPISQTHGTELELSERE